MGILYLIPINLILLSPMNLMMIYMNSMINNSAEHKCLHYAKISIVIQFCKFGDNSMDQWLTTQPPFAVTITTREMLTSVLSTRHVIIHTCNMTDWGVSHLLYCHGPTEYSSLLETSTLPFPLTIYIWWMYMYNHMKGSMA